MDAKTRARLIEVNRAFYEGSADAFSESRKEPWPGWVRAMSHVKRPNDGELRVLDVGCGNGRFGRFLANSIAPGSHGKIRYLGIDSSKSLLAHARDARVELDAVEFLACDLLELNDALPREFRVFDLIVAFGVLHHVPGEQTRRSFVETLISLLSDQGTLVVTAWQFGNSERFRTREIAWSSYNERARDPIDERCLEDGDYLLRFGTSPFARYCHFTSPNELRALFSHSPIVWLDEYCDDGKSNDLNLYAVVKRRPDEPR